MDDVSPKSANSVRRPALRRSRTKCFRCRHDHQKCLPEGREWNEDKRPCHRCRELGHECGPPERLSRGHPRTAQLSFPSVSMDSELTSKINDGSSPVTSRRTGSNTRSVSSLDDKGTCHATVGAQLSNDLPSQDVPVRRRKCCEAECRKLLKDLGDLKALHKNVSLDMDKMNDIEQHLHPYVTFAALKGSYRALFSTIDIATISLINTGTILLHSDKGMFTECFLERLKSFTDNFYNRGKAHNITSAKINQHALSEMARLKNIIQDAVYQSRRRKELYSDAELVCEALDGDPKHPGPPRLGSDADAAYLHAAADLEQVYNKLCVHKSSSQQTSFGADLLALSIQRGYPAPQLAYRVCDPWSALNLWNKSTSQQALDALHRSLLHYAVDADDINLVQHIARTNAQAIRNTGMDIFGMSLLALAAMRNNIKMFDLLSEYGAVCSGPETDTGVLIVAAHLGNVHIVQHMLSCRPNPQSLGKALNRAIERRHEEPIRLILECMQNPAFYDEKELENAAFNAEWRGLLGLAVKIRDVKPFFGNRSQALNDIERANFEDLGFSDNLSTYQPTTPAGWWQSGARTTIQVTENCVGHILSPLQSISNPGMQLVALPSQLDQEHFSPGFHLDATFHMQ